MHGLVLGNNGETAAIKPAPGSAFKELTVQWGETHPAGVTTPNGQSWVGGAHWMPELALGSRRASWRRRTLG